MLHLFLHRYNVAQPNRCLTKTASMDINQGNRKTIGVYRSLVYQVTQPPSYFCVILTEIILYQLPVYIIYCYTLSGRTGNALVWHSEGRTIEALSVQ